MKFQQNPTNAINNVGEVNRGRIGRGFRHDTTFNTGDLIPVAAFHVLPGDDLSVKINTLTRTIAQPIRQTMDYLVHDTYAFMCRTIILWHGVTPAVAVISTTFHGLAFLARIRTVILFVLHTARSSVYCLRCALNRPQAVTIFCALLDCLSI